MPTWPPATSCAGRSRPSTCWISSPSSPRTVTSREPPGAPWTASDAASSPTRRCDRACEGRRCPGAPARAPVGGGLAGGGGRTADEPGVPRRGDLAPGTGGGRARPYRTGGSEDVGCRAGRRGLRRCLLLVARVVDRSLPRSGAVDRTERPGGGAHRCLFGADRAGIPLGTARLAEGEGTAPPGDRGGAVDCARALPRQLAVRRLPLGKTGHDAGRGTVRPGRLVAGRERTELPDGVRGGSGDRSGAPAHLAPPAPAGAVSRHRGGDDVHPALSDGGCRRDADRSGAGQRHDRILR